MHYWWQRSGLKLTSQVIQWAERRNIQNILRLNPKLNNYNPIAWQLSDPTNLDLNNSKLSHCFKRIWMRLSLMKYANCLLETIERRVYQIIIDHKCTLSKFLGQKTRRYTINKISRLKRHHISTPLSIVQNYIASYRREPIQTVSTRQS